MASADAKDADSCCAHHRDLKAGGKEMSCCAGKDAKCCGGKDAKSCMKGDKTAASCCKDGCSKDKTASCMQQRQGRLLLEEDGSRYELLPPWEPQLNADWKLQEAPANSAGASF
jgi:hypothetical protein